jgi:hypothetical protein
MDLLAHPFAITVAVIVVLSALGAPIGLSMIGASIVYLWITGQDIGLAAEQVLQGLGLPYRAVNGGRGVRCIRLPFHEGTVSFTMDGGPAVKKLLGG